MFEKYIAQCDDGLFIVSPAALYPVMTRLQVTMITLLPYQCSV